MTEEPSSNSTETKLETAINKDVNDKKMVDKPETDPSKTEPSPIWFKTTHAYKISHDQLVALEKEGPVTIQLPDEGLITLSNYSFFLPDGKEILGLAVTGYLEVIVPPKRYDALIKKAQAGVTIRKNDPENLIALTLEDQIPKCIDRVQRVFQLARWRFNLSEDDNQIIHRNYSWSPDQKNWYPISYLEPPVATVAFIDEVNMSAKEISEEMTQLLKTESVEPVYHALIRDARAQRFVSPKSSFIIAVAALEVAIKQFIEYKSPEAGWIIANVNSPDIHKILSGLVPALEPAFTLDDDTLKEVRNIIGNRNTLVHKGIIDFNFQRMVDSITLISKIIRRVDFHCGRKWSV